ncbi:MAG: hypothetical protein AAFQ41_05535 [Cyanobacteria bacterium J06623_7]
MTEAKDSNKKQDSESSQKDKAKSAQKPAKKSKKVPNFEEEDLYKVHYDF